jgi:beta propeller repeat protein
MKINTKLLSVALAIAVVILFLILVPSAASADSLKISEIRITTSGSVSNPDIYEDKIVWQDSRNGGNPDVYLYDTSTQKETRITASGSAVNPAIYGNLIVWSDGRNGNGGDIYMYDLSAEKETRITTSGNAFNPDIYGNKIVWGSGRIYLYDLSTQEITQIANDSYYEGDDYTTGTTNYNPIIHGNRIAWISTSLYSDSFETSYENQLLVYDLSTMKKISIDSDMYFETSIHSHDICNNKIVWVKEYNFEHEGPIIFMYDFSTQKYTQITDGSVYASYSNLHIYDNRIVYDDISNNIRMYDLSTKNETKITTSGSASNPAFSSFSICM